MTNTKTLATRYDGISVYYEVRTGTTVEKFWNRADAERAMSATTVRFFGSNFSKLHTYNSDVEAAIAMASAMSYGTSCEIVKGGR